MHNLFNGDVIEMPLCYMGMSAWGWECASKFFFLEFYLHIRLQFSLSDLKLMMCQIMARVRCIKKGLQTFPSCFAKKPRIFIHYKVLQFILTTIEIHFTEKVLGELNCDHVFKAILKTVIQRNNTMWNTIWMFMMNIFHHIFEIEKRIEKNSLRPVLVAWVSLIRQQTHSHLI